MSDIDNVVDRDFPVVFKAKFEEAFSQWQTRNYLSIDRIFDSAAKKTLLEVDDQVYSMVYVGVYGRLNKERVKARDWSIFQG